MYEHIKAQGVVENVDKQQRCVKDKLQGLHMSLGFGLKKDDRVGAKGML